ncbi:MAG TPA: hypothetical protein VN809_01005 [Telmatospirillum sp.]|nr:hypothetical protein [Telmatospirillum sp.]
MRFDDSALWGGVIETAGITEAVGTAATGMGLSGRALSLLAVSAGGMVVSRTIPGLATGLGA